MNGTKTSDLALVAAVLGIAAVIFVPLPPFALDVMLTASLAVSVLVLLSVLGAREPAKLTSFPAVLLLVTAFRLALNVATTRQILGNAASEGTAAAGRVVEAFGLFVAGAEPLIGMVIFAILVLVNFVVITKGAGRISEVAARFTLDALPGKQMAIDADLNAGLIKEDEARARRTAVAREADFYGAMDGASKFVRGDAVAGLVITVVNLVAGVAVGWLRHGMGAGEALETFGILTVGDGLVSQVPALIVSLSAGLLVSRAGSSTALGDDVGGQLFSDPRALRAGAGFLAALLGTALFLGSGLPVLPLAGGAAALWFGASALAASKTRKEAAESERKAKERAASRQPERVEGLLHVDPMEVEVGAALVRWVDPAGGGGLLDRIGEVRRRLAAELGLVVPPVRILDNLQLLAGGYVIRLNGAAVGSGSLRADGLLAVDTGSVRGTIEGERTTDPAFGAPAVWIAGADRARAEGLGWTVAEPAQALATHLEETVRKHAAELLTRDDVQNLIRTLKERRPAVVEELVPAVLKPGEVQKVLQNLLREGVSIRDLGSILEAIGDVAPRSRDPEVLTEYARAALARAICRPHLDRDGRLSVVTLDPKLEDLIRGGLERSERGTTLALSPATTSAIADRVVRECDRLAAAGHPPVVLCSPAIRAALKRLLDAVRPGLAVLSYNEIVPDAKVEATARVALEGAL